MHFQLSNQIGEYRGFRIIADKQQQSLPNPANAFSDSKNLFIYGNKVGNTDWACELNNILPESNREKQQKYTEKKI